MGATTVYNSIISPNIKEHMKKIEEFEKEAHKGLEKGIERVRNVANWIKMLQIISSFVKLHLSYLYNLYKYFKT